MDFNGFINLFTSGEALGSLLVTLVSNLPVIAAVAGLIGKWRGNYTKRIKDINNALTNDFNELRADYGVLKASLEDTQRVLKEVETNSKKQLAVYGIAYANSNLSASTKTEILKTIGQEDIGKVDVAVENSNAIIEENKAAEKVETPANLEEIAKAVENGTTNTDEVIIMD